MKKQLLFILVVFITMGFSLPVYSQTSTPLVPRELDCIDLEDELNVVPGQPYTYTVEVPSPDGAKTFHWFVTQDESMISGGSIIANIEAFPGAILADGSVNYDDADAIDPNVTLTFSSFQLDTDEYVFVAVLVTNTDADGCETNNFKVYRILPVHAFSLDIANATAEDMIFGEDYGANIDNCLASIVAADYDATNNEMDYDFGVNTFYYVVAAANFSGSWQLRAELAGLTLSQTATITWGYTFATAGDNVIAPALSTDGEFTSPVLVEAQDESGAVGAAGEQIWIKMVIDHGNTFEGDAISQYSLAVNGNLVATVSPLGLVPNGADVHHEGTTCAQVDFDDIALQSLKPRPDVNSVSPPAPGFLPVGN